MVSKGVGLRSELARAEANREVEGGEVLRPASLSARKHFSSGKVLKILVVGDDVDAMLGTFKIMTPDFEAFENGE